MNEDLKGPWYKHKDFWVEKAFSYILPSIQAFKDELYQKEIISFNFMNICRVIFESNLIEGAGLSEGETKKVIFEHFPKIPASFDSFRELQNKKNKIGKIISENEFRNVMNAIILHDLDPTKIKPSIMMKGKSREYLEVVQHFRCLAKAIRHCSDYAILRIKYLLNIRDKDDTKKHAQANDLSGIFKDKKIKEILDKPGPRGKPKALSEKIIKELHRIIADKLLPPDADVVAGEYRSDNRIVGWDIIFPGPDLVPKSMLEFIKRSNLCIDDVTSGNIDMFYAAAKLSYDFVSIHPFPDFNGRLSRIIMNMVLMLYGCQFPISIRGSSKEKHRYFTALKRANNGNIEPLICLIAMRTAKTYEELDNHFKKAGLKSILSFEYRPL
jgi:fido (protein-threonine AMPylation protein)